MFSNETSFSPFFFLPFFSFSSFRIIFDDRTSILSNELIIFLLTGRWFGLVWHRVAPGEFCGMGTSEKGWLSGKTAWGIITENKYYNPSTKRIETIYLFCKSSTDFPLSRTEERRLLVNTSGVTSLKIQRPQRYLMIGPANG